MKITSDNENELIFQESPKFREIVIIIPGMIALIYFISTVIHTHGQNFFGTVSTTFYDFLTLAAITSFLFVIFVLTCPVIVTINKKDNLLSIKQRGVFNDRDITVVVNTVQKIQYASNPFTYAVSPGRLAPDFGGQSFMYSCSINLILLNDDVVSVGSTSLWYTDVYKNIATKLGEVINIPVEREK